MSSRGYNVKGFQWKSALALLPLLLFAQKRGRGRKRKKIWPNKKKLELWQKHFWKIFDIELL